MCRLLDINKTCEQNSERTEGKKKKIHCSIILMKCSSTMTRVELKSNTFKSWKRVFVCKLNILWKRNSFSWVFLLYWVFKCTHYRIYGKSIDKLYNYEWQTLLLCHFHILFNLIYKQAYYRSLLLCIVSNMVGPF